MTEKQGVAPSNSVLIAERHEGDTSILIWRRPCFRAGAVTTVLVRHSTDHQEVHTYLDHQPDGGQPLTLNITEVGATVGAITGLSPDVGRWLFDQLLSQRGSTIDMPAPVPDQGLIALDDFIRRQTHRRDLSFLAVAICIVALLLALVLVPPPYIKSFDMLPAAAVLR